MHDPVDKAGAAGFRAGVALAIVDAERMLEISKLSIGLAVIAQG
jgi:hypothetical protein